MRRVSAERQAARRELAVAVYDVTDHKDGATVRARGLERVLQAARSVLGHILTDQDHAALDGLRKVRQKQRRGKQLKLPAVETTDELGDQPPCIETSCGTTLGTKRYDGRCAKCADQHDVAQRSKASRGASR
ncbi:MAG: hypothetical protein EPN91_13090 [Salinibacterium sp.]|nr:MAG: hypothetical protein EPN91_13090 [Salinibacterium sp.]